MSVLQQIVSNHPVSDYYMGIPLGALNLWIAKILWNTTVQLKEIKAILFGMGNEPGTIQLHAKDIRRAHSRLGRHSSILQAMAAHTKMPLPEKIDE